MAGENLGLSESVAIALGGMIGGGIYAVLGVVTGLAGPATWFAFLLAGAVALCAGYSFNHLNDLTDAQGGAVTFVQSITGNTTLAGVMGWTLLFGYVGSMAMYAFAFGEFSVALPGVPASVGSVPLRPAISVLAVACFVGLNLLGARATGTAENVLVLAKVLILLGFGVAGIAYAVLVPDEPVRYGFDRLTTSGPLVAAGVSFVAFQGWQLLYYDQSSIADPVETIRRAVYVSIPAAVLIYALVAVATYAIVPDVLASNPHTALTVAAERVGSVVGLAALAGLLMSLSALFSTGSAINATMFSAGYFAKALLSADLLPDRVGDSSASGVPSRTILVLGTVTAGFAAYGSLGAITSFASVTFIVVFGTVSYLALGQRDRESVNPLPPALGLLGTAAFLPVMLYHLYTSQPETFAVVVVLAVTSVALELLYFERDVLEREIEGIEEILLGEEESLPPEP